MTVEKKWRLDSKSGTCGGDNMSTERQSKGERLMSEHAGRGSWCNAEGIAMETNGGKEQTRRRRRGLNRKEEITASYCGGGCFHERGGAGRQMSNKCGNGVK